MIALSGKRALVTGGGRGIGRATAILLARAGASVAVGYRSRKAEAEQTCGEIRRQGREAVALAGDLSDRATAERVVAEAVAALGGLDLLVVNHGIWPPQGVPLHEMTPEQWEATRRANLDGVFYVCRAAIPRIADGGRIVLVSSTAGQRGEAFHADYAATKGAVIALTKSLAVELAPRITVNCVAPGWVDTEMARPAWTGGGSREAGGARAKIEAGIPLGRIATAQDVAGPIVFLCSELARHITGEVLNVNGGSVLCG
ncbi:MAG TPA: SDR family NAD(P)-dependent oxidoreductase [Gemmatimonadales bacterium]|nr:SDR family NAD(P)-dependent oxidoreductase [Gemmatimonadales bacterium]